MAAQVGGTQFFGRITGVDGKDVLLIAFLPDGRMTDVAGTEIRPGLLDDGDGWHSFPAELGAEHGAAGVAAAFIALEDQHLGMSTTDIGKALKAARRELEKQKD